MVASTHILQRYLTDTEAMAVPISVILKNKAKI